ncbi:MAG: MopE-related protein [Pseudomonadota bacterium]
MRTSLLLLALTACAPISNQDLDADGWTVAQGDCDDWDTALHPEASDAAGDGIDQNCDGADGIDADGDGVASTASGGEDCWDDDATRAGIPTWYMDADADGWGADWYSWQACLSGEGAAQDGDCDDHDASVHPDATETCDGIDQDCDGDVDEDLEIFTWYADADGDGFGDPTAPEAGCEPPSGFVADFSDCDDTDPDVHPGADEWCDGVDTDCDGLADDPDALDATAWNRDDDGDGYGDPYATTLACTQPPDTTTDASDCDDGDAAVHPGATEVYYDGIDQDCDGANDYDQDADGYRVDPWGSDCDDEDPTISPAAPEIWYDGTDQDCDGLSDYDQDADGHDAEPWGDDCDDTRDYISPSEPEACNLYDDDCDGLIDGDDPDFEPICFADADGDGWGDPEVGLTTCTCGAGSVADDSDCDDSDADVRPGAPDADDDGADDDCDGLVDEERWVTTADAILSATAGIEYAGTSVAFLEEALVVGAPGADVAATNGGAAYIAPWPVSGEVDLDALSTLRAGSATGELAGEALASGDVDGDGVLDLVVGAIGCDDGGTDGGVAYLVLGPLTGGGSLALADAAFLGTTGDEAGIAVALADADGDGLHDLLVGTRGGDMAGLFYAPVGGTTDLASADARLLGASGDRTGEAVAGAGDVDGDGLDDLLIGARYSNGTAGSQCGRAWLVLGPPSGDVDLTTAADAALTGLAAYDNAGLSVAGPGDVDGDGYADLLVGAPYDDTAGIDAGAAYLVSGPVTGTVSLSTAVAIFTGESAGAQAGGTVAGAGDVDGDGRPDLLVAARSERCDGDCDGAVYLWLGPVGGTFGGDSAEFTWLSESGAAGRSLASGDIDGDGLSDLLIGSDQAGTGGGAWLVLGSSL